MYIKLPRIVVDVDPILLSPKSPILKIYIFPKLYFLTRLVGLHKNVFHLDVPMQKLLFVHFLQSPQDISQSLSGPLDCENLVIKLRLVGPQISPIAILHENIEFVAAFKLINDSDNILTLQLFHDCGLYLHILFDVAVVL